MRVFAVWLLASLTQLGAVEPRKSAADYHARSESATAALGAEYIGRFVTGADGSHAIGDYVAIELGYFPKTKKMDTIRGSDFMLKINGSKQLVYPQSAHLVAGAIKNPHWEQHRGLVTEAGVRDVDVVIGAPRRRSRFPGDPTVREPLPDPRTDQGSVRGPAKDPLEEAAEAVISNAFTEGEGQGVRAGYIYFIYKKKLSTLKKIELVWVSGGEKRSLVLK